VTVAKKLKKLGMHASDTAELYFEDVRVPVGNEDTGNSSLNLELIHLGKKVRAGRRPSFRLRADQRARHQDGLTGVSPTAKAPNSQPKSAS
jgi:hypothetical protein